MKNLKYRFIGNGQELEKAFDIRRQVFVGEQGIPEEIELDENDKEALHILVEYDTGIVATARARFPAAGMAKIERMAVLKDFRRRGIGKEIIASYINEFEKRKINHVVLHAQYAVIEFYKSCGFRETGEPFLEAGIKHIKMFRKL